MIFVPPTSQSLELQLKVPERLFKPGDEAQLTLDVKDSQGAPASAHVLIAAYDQSLDQLAAPQTDDIMRTFYGRTTPHWARGESSLSLRGSIRAAQPELQTDDQLRLYGFYDSGFTVSTTPASTVFEEGISSVASLEVAWAAGVLAAGWVADFLAVAILKVVAWAAVQHQNRQILS